MNCRFHLVPAGQQCCAVLLPIDSISASHVLQQASSIAAPRMCICRQQESRGPKGLSIARFLGFNKQVVLVVLTEER